MDKNLKESMNALLRMPVKNGDPLRGELIEMGKRPKSIDYGDIIALTLYKKARGGDLAAIKEVRSLDEKEQADENTVVKIVDDVL